MIQEICSKKHSDRRLSVQLIAEKPNMNWKTVRYILAKELEEIPSKMVPLILTISRMALSETTWLNVAIVTFKLYFL